MSATTDPATAAGSRNATRFTGPPFSLKDSGSFTDPYKKDGCHGCGPGSATSDMNGIYTFLGLCEKVEGPGGKVAEAAAEKLRTNAPSEEFPK